MENCSRVWGDFHQRWKGKEPKRTAESGKKDITLPGVEEA